MFLPLYTVHVHVYMYVYIVHVHVHVHIEKELTFIIPWYKVSKIMINATSEAYCVSIF